MNELEMIGIFPEREGFRREKVGGFIFVKPLEMKQMRDHVVDILMQKIMSGDLKDGDPLVQQTIAEQTGLSRMPVREALQALEHKGFVRYLPNRHVEVMGVTKNTIISTFRVLAALEVEMIKLINFYGKADLSVLQHILAELKNAIELDDSSESIAIFEMNFHLELVRLIQNPYLGMIQAKFLDSYFSYAIDHFPRNSGSILLPLERILQALIQQDSSGIAKDFDEYYSCIVDAMIEGGNYE